MNILWNEGIVHPGVSLCLWLELRASSSVCSLNNYLLSPMLIHCPTTGNIQLICTHTVLLGVEILEYFLTICWVTIATKTSFSPPPKSTVLVLMWRHIKHCFEAMWEPSNPPTLVLGKLASMSLLLFCQGVSKEDVTLAGDTVTPRCRNLWYPFGSRRLWLLATG